MISRITITATPMHVKATAPRCSSRVIQATSSSFAHAFHASLLKLRLFRCVRCEDEEQSAASGAHATAPQVDAVIVKFFAPAMVRSQVSESDNAIV